MKIRPHSSPPIKGEKMYYFVRTRNFGMDSGLSMADYGLPNRINMPVRAGFLLLRHRFEIKGGNLLRQRGGNLLVSIS